MNVSGQLINNLRFADDIDLIAESQEGLQHLTNKVNQGSKRLGLQMNTKKTKTMAINKNHVDMDITLNNEKSKDGKCDQDIKRRSSHGISNSW